MKTSDNGIKLIAQFEGLRLKPYLCSANVPTIGYGTTVYPNGIKVRLTDAAITETQATEYLRYDVARFEKQVNKLIGSAKLTQNQYDAIVSFTYNLGPTNFGKSTLLKKIVANPNHPDIATEFAKWNKAAGQVVAGLTKRRKIESDLYFK